MKKKESPEFGDLCHKTTVKVDSRLKINFIEFYFLLVDKKRN